MREIIYNDTQLEEAPEGSVIAGQYARDFYQEKYSFIKNHEGGWSRVLRYSDRHHVLQDSNFSPAFLQQNYDVLLLVATEVTVAEPHEKPFIF